MSLSRHGETTAFNGQRKHPAEALAALLAEEHDRGIPDALASHLTEPLVRQALRLAEGMERAPATPPTPAVALLLVQLAELGHPDEAIRPALLEWIKDSLRQLSHRPSSSCCETSPASAP